MPSPADRGCGVRDGASVRWAASVLRADAGSAGASSGAAGRRLGHGIRASIGRVGGPVLHRARDADAPFRCRRRATDALRRRRRAMARPSVGAGTRFRSAAAGRGSSRTRLRGARAEPRAGGTSGAGCRRSGRPRREGGARVGGHGAVGRTGSRPDRRRDTWEPAGADRAAARSDARRAGRWLRAGDRFAALGAHRGELQAAPGPTSSGHPGAVARRRRRAGRRPADRVARRRVAGCRRKCAGPGVARPALSSSASACDSVTRSCDRPSTGRRR